MTVVIGLIIVHVEKCVVVKLDGLFWIYPILQIPEQFLS